MEEIKTVSYPKQREALKIGSVTYRSSYDQRLTENDLNRARVELGETEEKKAISLLKLKDALISDKDFSYRLDDEYLLRFLRFRKYNIERAYRTLRKLYEYRKSHPDMFGIPSNLEFFLRLDVANCLPYRDEEGSLIYWIDTHKWKVDEMFFTDIMNLVHVIADVISVDPTLQVNGSVSIWDAGGFTAGHFVRYAYPTIIRPFLKSLQSTYPWRIKRVFLVNCNGLLRGLYFAIRYLLSKKVADRVILLGSDYTELHKYLNPRILPTTFGGCIDPSECSMTQHLLDNLPYIKYERSFGKKTEY